MPRGKHPHNALSAKRVATLSEPGRHGDGNGLYLIVDKSGAKRWVLRTAVRGRRRDMGLGGVRTVSLAQARATAQRYRAIARSDGDPLEERRRESKEIPTFEKAAITVHKGLVPSWKNPKHAAQWINTLKRYAFPLIGSRPVSQITSADRPLHQRMLLKSLPRQRRAKAPRSASRMPTRKRRASNCHPSW